MTVEEMDEKLDAFGFSQEDKQLMYQSLGEEDEEKAI